MSRRDDTLDPGLAAELDQLEALFADDVRATAARPDPEFRGRLDRRVAGGFPRAQREWPAWVRWSPAFAVAATALVALVVVLGSGGTSTTRTRRRAAPRAAAPGGVGVLARRRRRAGGRPRRWSATRP